MALIDRKEARALVNRLRRKNGGLSTEQRERMDEDYLGIIDSLREQLGGSVQRSRYRTEESCVWRC